MIHEERQQSGDRIDLRIETANAVGFVGEGSHESHDRIRDKGADICIQHGHFVLSRQPTAITRLRRDAAF